MISFDDFTNDEESVNLSPIYNSISALSSNSYELYTMITNSPNNEYMKAYNSTAGNYQYNISGTLSRLGLSNTYNNIEGNYNISSCTFSKYSSLCMNLKSMSNNLYSSNTLIDINWVSNRNNTYSSFIKLKAYGNYFTINTIQSGILCDINCLYICDNYFANISDSNNINCYEFARNAVSNSGNYNISVNRLSNNTFSNLIRVNLDYLTSYSNRKQPYIFASISTLQLNKYIPTSNSNNVNYANITNFVLGHPEDLFDSNGSFTQTELDSNKVYLSEVPVSLLGGNGTTITYSTPYMKAYNSTDGNYQYNISGTLNNLVLSNTFDKIEGNCKISSCTFSKYSSLGMKLNSMSNNLYTSNTFIDAKCFSNQQNTYSSFIKLNAYGNYLTVNTIKSGRMCDINCLYVGGNHFENNTFSNNINCYEFAKNTVSDSGNYNISVIRLYNNTFSTLTRLNLDYLSSYSNSTSPYIFESISTLQLNKYIPASNNIRYINITNYVLGHPEDLFDSNGIFTQTELDSNKVYLSEVPVSLLRGNGSTITYATPYMKAYNSTDGNYQYNLSGSLNNSDFKQNSNVCLFGPYTISGLTMTDSFNRFDINCNVLNTFSCNKIIKFMNITADSISKMVLNSCGKLDINAYSVSYGDVFSCSEANIKAHHVSQFSPISMYGDLHFDAWNVDTVNFYSGNRTINIGNSCSGISINEGRYADFSAVAVYDLNASNISTLRITAGILNKANFENIQELDLNEVKLFADCTFNNIGYLKLPSITKSTISTGYEINVTNSAITSLDIRHLPDDVFVNGSIPLYALQSYNVNLHNTSMLLENGIKVSRYI